MIRQHVDHDWFRHSLIQDNLAHWLEAVPSDNGFYKAALDRQWRPLPKQTATLVSQCRLMFVLSCGYDLTGQRRYLEAVGKGADFLLKHFRDEQYAGWFWSVDPDGKVLEANKTSYGHAFVIFGLAHAYRLTRDERFKSAAIDTWLTMKTCLRDEQGGFKPGTNRDFSIVRGGNSQNPIMHLFEALLALHDATGSEEIFSDAQEVAGFVFGRLYQSEGGPSTSSGPPRRVDQAVESLSRGGYLAEMYDADWRPQPIDRGGYVDVGHQFEWAFLLSRAVEKGFDQKYLAIGNRLIEYGTASGYDRQLGGIFSRADYAGGGLGRERDRGPQTRATAFGDPVKGWWQQCELLRALVNYAAGRGRDDLWPMFDQSLAFVQKYFIDDQYGGWYGAYDGRDFPPTGDRADKASVWKIGYHDAGMYVEALRVCGGMPQGPRTNDQPMTKEH